MPADGSIDVGGNGELLHGGGHLPGLLVALSKGTEVACPAHVHLVFPCAQFNQSIYQYFSIDYVLVCVPVEC